MEEKKDVKVILLKNTKFLFKYEVYPSFRERFGRTFNNPDVAMDTCINNHSGPGGIV